MGWKRIRRFFLAACLAAGVVSAGRMASAGVVEEFEEVMRLYRLHQTVEAAKLLSDLSKRVTGDEARLLRRLAGGAYLAELAARDDMKDAMTAIINKAAAEDARKRGDAEYMRKLALTVVSDDQSARLAALNELKFHGPYSAPFLLGLFKENLSGKQRINFISGMQVLGRRMTFPLIAALQSDNGQLVETVLISLAKIFDPVSVPALFEFAARTENLALKRAALKLAADIAKIYRVPVADEVAPFEWLARACLEGAPMMEIDALAKEFPMWSWSKEQKTVVATMVPRPIYLIRTGLKTVRFGLERAPGDKKLLGTMAQLLVEQCLAGGEGASQAAQKLFALGPDVLLMVVDECIRKGPTARLEKALDLLAGFGPVSTVDGPAVGARGAGVLLKAVWHGSSHARIRALQCLCCLGMVSGLDPMGAKLFSEAVAGELAKRAGLRRSIIITRDKEFGRHMAVRLAKSAIALDVATSAAEFQNALELIPSPDVILVHAEMGRGRKKMYALASGTGLRTVYIGSEETRKKMDIDGEGPFEYISLPTTTEYMAGVILGKDKPKVDPQNLALVLQLLAQLPADVVLDRRRDIAGVLNLALARTEGDLRLAIIAQLNRLGDLRSYPKLMKLAGSDEADGATRIVALRAIGLISRRTGQKPDTAVLGRIVELTKGSSDLAEQARRTLGLVPMDANDTWRTFNEIFGKGRD